MTSTQIPTMAEMMAEGKQPEVLFWVGCAGSFDDRAKRISKSLASILQRSGVSFAVLGTEESCTGDPAKRAGNEFLFQMQAMTNIQVLDGYEIKRIVTACPHCLNTIKNEYPSLGGNYEIYHHTQFLVKLFQEGRLKVEGGSFKGRKITFHDPCYLGRANGEYEAPRTLLELLDADLHEMEASRSRGMCCGAGGAQMFKEAEKGVEEVNLARTRQILDTESSIVAAACPFCNTMLTDGIKHHEKEGEIKVLDIAEIIASTQK